MAGGSKRFQHDTMKLFKASVIVSLTCCYDKLLQVYMLGLKILQATFSEPICGPEITAREMNREFLPFIKLLLTKVEELNFKVRDETQHTLIAIFKNPKLDEGKIIEAIMEIVYKGPSPSKAPERIILGRLELLLYLLQQIGINEKNTWDYVQVLNELVVPSLLHQKSNVRWMAQQIISVLYNINGDPVKDIVQAGCQQLGVR